MAKYKVEIGKSFDVEAVEEVTVPDNVVPAIMERKVVLEETRTRSFVVRAVMLVSGVVLSGAAGFGMLDGSFNELQAVWAVDGPVIAAVMARYLPKD